VCIKLVLDLIWIRPLFLSNYSIYGLSNATGLTWWKVKYHVECIVKNWYAARTSVIRDGITESLQCLQEYDDGRRMTLSFLIGALITTIRIISDNWTTPRPRWDASDRTRLARPLKNTFWRYVICVYVCSRNVMCKLNMTNNQTRNSNNISRGKSFVLCTIVLIAKRQCL